MATMDDLIDKILAKLPDPTPQVQFINLDTQVPSLVQLPADETWTEFLNNTTDEFEADSTRAVFSTWGVEVEDPLDIGTVEIASGICACSG